MFFENLDQTFLNNTLNSWVNALLAFLATIIAVFIAKKYIIVTVKTFASKTETKVDDMIIKALDGIGFIFYLVLGVYIGSWFLDVDPFWSRTILASLVLILTLFTAKSLQEIISYSLRNWVEKQNQKSEKRQYDPSVVRVFNWFTGVVIWTVALLFVLQNFNVNVATLIGGLGIGGLAIAFALQNILGDIFASFSIYLDKPFQTGDTIKVGDFLGTVERIGIKSTRIRMLYGEELVIGNTDLTNSRVQNFHNLQRRRIDFSVGLEYDTDPKLLREVSKTIEGIIDPLEICTFDRCHFKEFADFSLNYEIVYFVETPDYNVYMDVQQKINLEIVDAFAAKGIQMAFPTQTVIVKK